jgi:hypothetical protein
MHRAAAAAAWLALAVQAAPACGQRAAELPGKRWERAFGHPRLDHQPTALGATRDDSGVWIGGSTREVGAGSRGAAVWIWKVGQAGDIVERLSLGSVKRGADGGDGARYLTSLLETADGSLLAAVEFEAGRPSLVAVRNREVSAQKILLPTRSSYTIEKIVEAPEGGAYAVGDIGASGLLLRLGPTGQVLWHRIFQKQGQVVGIDLLARPEGGGIAVWNSGRPGGFRLHDSTVWLSMFSAKGEIQKEVSLAGRWGSIARHERGYALAYDAGGDDAQEVRFVQLDRDLGMKLESTLATGTFGLSGFRMVALPDGDSVVAGSLDGVLWVSRVSAEGKPRWSSTAMESSLWRADGLVRSGDGVFVLSPVMDVNAANQLSRDVGLMRLAF